MLEILVRKEEQGLSEVGKLYWKSLTHAIWWSVWEERNRRIFENKKQKAWRTVNRAKYHLWGWNKTVETARGIRIEELMFEFGKLVRER
ncbi:hypothetical protein ACHQM5_002670 [Ranunculus cassubicifolius]